MLVECPQNFNINCALSYSEVNTFFLVKPRYVLKAEDANFTPVDVACGPKMVGDICS